MQVSAETVSKTNLGDWVPGKRVNLERALKVGDELGGHIVSGHVDGVAEVVALRDEGDSTRVTLRAPDDLAVCALASAASICPRTSAHSAKSGSTMTGFTIIMILSRSV